MKNVMLIGKLNQEMQTLYDSLAPICRPQICVDSEPVIQAMLKMVAPDLVTVCLDGTECSCENVFYLLESAPSRPTVVAVGDVEIERTLIKSRYLPNNRVVFMQSPVRTEDVLQCAKGFLSGKDAPQDGRERILVVDDDPNTVRLLYKMLSKHWNISAATSGMRAIAAIVKSRPDLILLDYDMPKIDGKMTLEILRAEKETKDIPVVFLTGVSDSTIVEEILALGPQGYLLKPPSEEKIYSKVTDVLKKAALTRAQQPDAE